MDSGDIGDIQHFPLSVHERRALWVQLCGEERFWSPALCPLFCCWASGSEKKGGQWVSMVTIHLFWCNKQPGGSKGSSSAVLTHFPEAMRHPRAWDTHCLPHVPPCQELAVPRALLWAQARPPRQGTQWGCSFTTRWGRAQLSHAEKASGTSRDAPVLASCLGTLVLGLTSDPSYKWVVFGVQGD